MAGTVSVGSLLKHTFAFVPVSKIWLMNLSNRCRRSGDFLIPAPTSITWIVLFLNSSTTASVVDQSFGSNKYSTASWPKDFNCSMLASNPPLIFSGVAPNPSSNYLHKRKYGGYYLEIPTGQWLLVQIRQQQLSFYRFLLTCFSSYFFSDADFFINLSISIKLWFLSSSYLIWRRKMVEASRSMTHLAIWKICLKSDPRSVGVKKMWFEVAKIRSVKRRKSMLYRKPTFGTLVLLSIQPRLEKFFDGNNEPYKSKFDSWYFQTSSFMSYFDVFDA